MGDKTITHAWKFCRIGGVDQVVFRNGADLAHLDQLDQKLWLALSMPTTGVHFDRRTAELLDTDRDGRIRPPEVLAAVRWLREVLSDLGCLMAGTDSVELSMIRNADILDTARRVLANRGKPGATSISLQDVLDQMRLFAGMRFNGDGVVAPDTADDDATRQAIMQIAGVMGATQDLGGKPGINQAVTEGFFGQVTAWLDWTAKPETDATILPLGPEGTAKAAAAVRAVKAKVDDYFVRCRLAGFDVRAKTALNGEDQQYTGMAAELLTLSSESMGKLPLARIGGGKTLPLGEGVNPAWEQAVCLLAEQAVQPLVGTLRNGLSETDWGIIQSKLAPYEAWMSARPATGIGSLGTARLRELKEGPFRAAILDLIRQDLELANEQERLEVLEKLVRYHRDVYELLTNYVNFADFYGGTLAIFQAGTLYLDTRACALCIEVMDPVKHAGMAGLSAAFLAYCDVTRVGKPKRQIAAVFTDGDSDNLMVGRNGVFYDRQGLDWDATITKIVANPISVREAFWLPYKKSSRFIEEQVIKRAQAAEAASLARMSDTAATVASADKMPAAAGPVPPKKIELGTIALIGTAIGGISALVGGFLQALFGLGFWLPLGLVGVMLLISGPSVLLAVLKLRQRNLGPILDANGWAINTRARMNAAFGAALTQVASIPPGSERSLVDPYAPPRRTFRRYLLALALVIFLYGWWNGFYDRFLPEGVRRNRPVSAASVPPSPGTVVPVQS